MSATESHAISLTRKILTLLAGNASAQLVLALGSVILARLFAPEQFGEFGFVVSAGMVLSHVVTLSLENTFMLTRTDEQKAITFALMAINFVMVSLGMAVGSAFFIGNTIKSVWISWELVFAVILSTFLYSTFKASTQYRLSVNQFRRVSAAKLIQSTSIVLFQVALFQIQTGLLLGYFAGTAVALVIILPWALPFFRLSPNDFWAFLRRYRNFPLFAAPANLLAALSTNAVVFLMPFVLDFSAVGLYLMAHRITSLPLTYLTTSIGQAYFSEITGPNADIRRTTEKLILRSWLLATPVFLLFMLGSEPAFRILLGDEWRQSGQIASILAPLLLITFAVSPLSYIFPATENQKLDLWVSLVIFIFRIAGLLIGSLSHDVLTTILGYSVFGSISLGIYSYFILRISEASRIWSLGISFVPLVGFWAVYWLARTIHLI